MALLSEVAASELARRAARHPGRPEREGAHAQCELGAAMAPGLVLAPGGPRDPGSAVAL